MFFFFIRGYADPWALVDPGNFPRTWQLRKLNPVCEWKQVVGNKTVQCFFFSKALGEFSEKETNKWADIVGFLFIIEKNTFEKSLR